MPLQFLQENKTVKIDLTTVEQLTITTALKLSAKECVKVMDGNPNEYYVQKLKRTRELYKKFTGRDMNLSEGLGEL